MACDNPHANRLTLHILAAVAEAEAKAISDRTRAVLTRDPLLATLVGRPIVEESHGQNADPLPADRGELHLAHGSHRTPDGKRVTKRTPGAVRTVSKSAKWYESKDIAKYLHDRRKEKNMGGQFGISTFNHSLVAIKGFTRWMATTRPARTPHRPASVRAGQPDASSI